MSPNFSSPRHVSPFSRGVIFKRARFSLALLSLRINRDYSQSRQNRPFAASHSRGSKLPCWRPRHALRQDNERADIILLFSPSASFAPQHGGVCTTWNERSITTVLRPSTDVIHLTLTLKMTTAQVVETSLTVNNNSPIQDCIHPDDHTQPAHEMTPGGSNLGHTGGRQVLSLLRQPCSPNLAQTAIPALRVIDLRDMIGSFGCLRAF